MSPWRGLALCSGVMRMSALIHVNSRNLALASVGSFVVDAWPLSFTIHCMAGPVI